MHAESANVARGQSKLLLVILVCLAPVVASYITYYYIHPETRTNYGELIEQRPLPALHLHELDGRNFDESALKGKWSFVMVADAACDKACEDKLYHMRQVRLTTGKERDRVQRIWLIPDAGLLSTQIIREYDGTLMLRADPAEIARWLPAAPGDVVTDHIFVVDPLGNLMMRFPKDADPNRTKRDISKLLNASSIG